VPAGKMWRVDEEAFLNSEGAADGNADGCDGSSFVGCGGDQGLKVVEDFREDFGEGLLSSRGHLDSLKNLAAGRAFNTGGFSAADIEAEDRMFEVPVLVHGIARECPQYRRAGLARQ